MAIFSFKCPDHGVFHKMLEKGTKSFSCPKCGKDSKRILKAGNVIVTEVIDNGIMGKSIERPTNINELMEERIQNYEKTKLEDY